jgi:tetratricopeptide (TPR) repeat protein
MENKKLTTVLLGGSNSVLQNGIASGLSQKSQLINLALGASSSLQNLYEIIRNKTIIDNADLIISESNINDYHVNGLKDSLVPIETVLSNIDKLYSVLSGYINKTIIILYPMCLDFKNKNLIYRRHLANINKYSFSYIDLHETFERQGFIETLNQGPDDHPYSQMMSELGKLIVDRKEDIYFKSSPAECSLDTFSVWKPKHNNITKENSKFCENIAVLRGDEQAHLPESLIGWDIIAAHCWNGDEASKFTMVEGTSLAIETLEGRYIKPFNTECQFHDFYKPITITPKTKLYPTSDDITEKSIRARYSVSSKELRIVALFLIKKCKSSDIKIYNDIQTSGNKIQLFDGMISAVMLSIIQHNKISQNDNNQLIAMLGEFAIELQEKNIDMACKLMHKAHQLRPTDSVIKEAFISLATSATKQKEWGKAKELWHKVRALFPDKAIGYSNGAMVCRNMGEFLEALSLINYTLKYHEITLYSLVQKGHVLMKSNMLADARIQWESIRDDFPDNIDCYVQDAVACRRLGLFEEGLNLLDESIAKHEVKSEHLIQKAHLLMKLSRFKEASKLWGEVRNKYSTNIDGYIQGGICHQELGEINKATALFDIATKNASNST